MRRLAYIPFLLMMLILSLIGNGCTVNAKIKDGTTAYQQKQYAVAIDMLGTEIADMRDERLKAGHAYMLGDAYLQIEEISAAVRWLETAVAADHSNEALLALAKAYKKQGNYQAAIATYQELQEHVVNRQQIDREIYVIKEVVKWQAEETPGVRATIVDQSSGYSEYSPVILDQNFLVFTSDREGATGGDTYGWTGNKHSDLFVMFKTGSDVRRFDALINTDDNEGTAAFTKDGIEMVFTRCSSDDDADAYCRLMYSQRFDGLWSRPQELSLFDASVNVGHPTFIEGDSVLVFSARRDEGYGGYDLYYCERLIDAAGSLRWSEPYLLPQTINSQGNEMFPSGDGDTLYFSSDYFAGLGGLDIFKTWINPNGTWAPPQNLKRPINSSYDDFGLVVDRTASVRGEEIEKGFFTSTREGYGKEDLYRYVRRRVTPVAEDEAAEDTPIVNVDIYLAGRALEVQYEVDDDPNTPRIPDAPLAGVALVLEDGQERVSLQSDDAGNFFAELQPDRTYTIKASKDGYLNDVATVSTENLVIAEGELSTTVNAKVVLSKVFTGVEITLDDIYYDFEKWDIREDARPTLDSLTALLVANPQIAIQLGSHTDCRGELAYNQDLSQKRAQSAVDYISGKGIDASRLRAVGYGEAKPEVDCLCESCTDEQHQSNRRTTFQIL